MTIQVGIYIFDNVEVLDFAGPYEVFTCATRVNRGDTPLFNVFTVGESLSPVRARAGLKIDPDFTMDKHPVIDCLIVPGGVVSAELVKQNVLEWIAKQALTTTIAASVCTGAFLLAAAGVMEGKSATTHWEDVTDLRAMFPWLSVKEGVRWVDEDEIVTSAGISAGIDMSLHLVERFKSRELALLTAKQLEFDWTESQP
ncbi:transcriptional regulator, AraC family [Klebsiella quasipneumoniae]|uniref:DJ-1/PfpI family protein n=2 Tax=Klebsiella pneumoniae complex TaxID=3390273 RepID=A0A2A5MB66_9ENTR|nr:MULTISPECIES: DJ-1/PfpI family protein [Klebsiella]ELS4551033.1 DJ-1/PfpI family protein [Klebsiella michiganensis]AVR40192.1 glutamine amidotransferase [Klebsiella quasipneumoniae]AZJ07677.1 DJ-1/PfpI family protein [Klebsiella quasipneumoniae]AZJ30818.1 DJ-1/PfpI family protein [Klebsiella quasipneumoniae subsp. similipneumoniae]EKU2796642.1 DJ-1/PfpI family protein [Klebsiella variicola]